MGDKAPKDKAKNKKAKAASETKKAASKPVTPSKSDKK